VALPAEPVALAALAAGTDPLAPGARTVLAKIDWPGRPAPVVPVTPLTADEERRYADGATLFRNLCVGCHQEDGYGRERLGADLLGSSFVNGADAAQPVRILLGGKEGSIGLMPPLGASLTDDQIAAVLTYIRRAWGHTASAISPLEVSEVRALTRDRTRPWTEAELQPPAGRGGRGGGRGGRGGAGPQF
jgi:mono/diheme cytochrome c family protein